MRDKRLLTPSMCAADTFCLCAAAESMFPLHLFTMNRRHISFGHVMRTFSPLTPYYKLRFTFFFLAHFPQDLTYLPWLLVKTFPGGRREEGRQSLLEIITEPVTCRPHSLTPLSGPTSSVFVWPTGHHRTNPPSLTPALLTAQ